MEISRPFRSHTLPLDGPRATVRWQRQLVAFTPRPLSLCTAGAGARDVISDDGNRDSGRAVMLIKDDR